MGHMSQKAGFPVDFDPKDITETGLEYGEKDLVNTCQENDVQKLSLSSYMQKLCN